jgi:hypothetical protein
MAVSMIDFLHRRALPSMRGEICWFYLIGHPSNMLKYGDEKLFRKRGDAVISGVLGGTGCRPVVMRGGHNVLETRTMDSEEDQVSNRIVTYNHANRLTAVRNVELQGHSRNAKPAFWEDRVVSLPFRPIHHV